MRLSECALQPVLIVIKGACNPTGHSSAASPSQNRRLAKRSSTHTKPLHSTEPTCKRPEELASILTRL